MTFIPDSVLNKLVAEAEQNKAAPQPVQVVYTGWIKVTRVGNIGTIEILNAEDWKLFQVLVQRGANLWPDAPPQIKELADLVTNGKVMQDYFKQANVTNVNNLPPSGELK